MATIPKFLYPLLRAHETTLSTCSSGESPKDQMLFSINDISFEKVNIGINLVLAVGLIFNKISLLNGPMIRLGFRLLNNFDFIVARI